MRHEDIVKVIYPFKMENRINFFKGHGIHLGVMSKQCIEAVEFKIPAAVISIRSQPGAEHIANIHLEGNIKGVLFLDFEDIDLVRCEAYGGAYGFEKQYIKDIKEERKIFTREQAEDILLFTKQHKDILVVAQCEAGIARSPGVAMALSKIYNGDFEWMVNIKHYRPNLTVCDTILEVNKEVGK